MDGLRFQRIKHDPLWHKSMPTRGPSIPSLSRRHLAQFVSAIDRPAMAGEQI
jgi:hypothetical protein